MTALVSLYALTIRWSCVRLGKAMSRVLSPRLPFLHQLLGVQSMGGYLSRHTASEVGDSCLGPALHRNNGTSAHLASPGPKGPGFRGRLRGVRTAHECVDHHVLSQYVVPLSTAWSDCLQWSPERLLQCPQPLLSKR